MEKRSSNIKEQNININSNNNPPPIELNITIKNNYLGMIPQTMENTQKRVISFNPIRRKKRLGNSTSVKNIGISINPSQMNHWMKKNNMPVINKKMPKTDSELGNSQKVKISLSRLQKLLKEKTLTRHYSVNKESNMHIKKLFSVTNPGKSSHTKETSNQISVKNFPMTAIQALKHFSKELSDSEKSEILDYDKVYYMGNGIAHLSFENTNKLPTLF